FRGILGVYRMRKLQALLLLAGVPSDSIQRQHDADGDLSSIVEQDLQTLTGCGIAIVGGLSDMARQEMWLQQGTIQERRQGRLVSFNIVDVIIAGREIRLALLSYPYGDLCRYVGETLRAQKIELSVFIGSAGSMMPDLARGDAVCPEQVYS